MVESDNTADDGNKPSRGIQSIEVGGKLLKALVASGGPMALKDLARASGMTPAKAHPYMVSFGKLGLIEQNATDGRYGLGAMAIQMGLIGLKQTDPVRLAFETLPALAEAMGCTCSAAVWADGVPVIVRVEEPSSAVRVAMKHGLTASLRKTATGKIFTAFGPEPLIRRAYEASMSNTDWNDPAFVQERNKTRELGMATVKGELIDGVNAIAVPVFNGLGRLVLAIAAMAPAALLSTEVKSESAQRLVQAGQQLSEQLGHAPN